MSATATTPFPTSFTFRVGQPEQITWVLTDVNNQPVSNAIVKATMYTDRNLQDPVTTPGTPDSVIDNLLLTETTTGTYQSVVPITFNPQEATINYILVITATDQSSNPLANWSIPCVIIFPQSAIDLVLLDDVKSFLHMPESNTDDDKLIQLLITAFSRYVLNRTGQTSFKQVNTYTEYYDGNGRQKMFLRNYPIVSITSLIIGSYSVPQSQDTVSPGFYIEDTRKSVAFRYSPNWMLPQLNQGLFPYSFVTGQGNIQVTYTAGYQSVPFDLQEACLEAIATNYRRKDWIDLMSRSVSIQGGAGTTTFRSWELPPHAEAVINFYSRRAMS